VLIASLDPAHNLGDVLGAELSGEPSKVEDNLYAMEVDLAAWVQIYLQESRNELAATYSYNLTLNLDSFFDIMKYSPGTEEYAVLWAIEHIRCDLAETTTSSSTIRPPLPFQCGSSRCRSSPIFG
jgi:arsenite-transporting ATPase